MPYNRSSMTYCWYICFLLSLAGGCTDITFMLLGGKENAPTFHTIGFMFDDAVLVHTNLLLCVIYYQERRLVEPKTKPKTFAA